MNKLLNFGLGMLAGAALWSAGVPARAQEKSARPTRAWQVWTIPEVGAYDEVRVDVVDTEGVCLYIERTYPGAHSKPSAITAVPKTQLPQGVGCQ